jgi:hypothetical protein
VGNVNLEGGSATTDLTIAGNVTVSGGLGNSEIRADHNQAASAGFIIAGDGVGSPTLTLASSEAIGTLGGITVISALTLALETNASIFANFGTAIIATGTNTVTNDGGKLEAAGSGELFIDSLVNNASGFIIAGGGDFGFEGGTVVISGAVTGASSTVAIDGYGMLELASGGSVASMVQLHGTGNTLRLDTGRARSRPAFPAPSPAIISTSPSSPLPPATTRPGRRPAAAAARSRCSTAATPRSPR